jgi:hypothetical protein
VEDGWVLEGAAVFGIGEFGSQGSEFVDDHGGGSEKQGLGGQVTGARDR